MEGRHRVRQLHADDLLLPVPEIAAVPEGLEGDSGPGSSHYLLLHLPVHPDAERRQVQPCRDAQVGFVVPEPAALLDGGAANVLGDQEDGCDDGADDQTEKKEQRHPFSVAGCGVSSPVEPSPPPTGNHCSPCRRWEEWSLHRNPQRFCFGTGRGQAPSSFHTKSGTCPKNSWKKLSVISICSGSHSLSAT